MTIESLSNKNDEKVELSLKDLVISIKRWISFLLKRWYIIFSFGVVGGILGFTYAYFEKPVYTAVTTFVLEDDKSSVGGLGSIAGLASMAGVDLGAGGGGIFQGDNILELYKSRTMIQKALLTEVNHDGRKELLIDEYIRINNMRDAWADKPGLKDLRFTSKSGDQKPGLPLQFSRLQDSILTEVVDDVNKSYLKVAKPDKKLSIISAEVSSKDEYFSKAFNEQIVKNVNDFYIQTKTKKSLENVLILQQKVDSVRTVMNGAIYSAASVADATPNMNPTRLTQRVAPMQRSQFSAETNKLMLSELVKNLELSKISLRKETPLIQVIDSPTFPLKKSRVGKVKGMVLGGIVFSLLSVLLIGSREFVKDLMKD